jgi:hypothetical protein
MHMRRYLREEFAFDKYFGEDIGKESIESALTSRLRFGSNDKEKERTLRPVSNNPRAETNTTPSP